MSDGALFETVNSLAGQVFRVPSFDGETFDEEKDGERLTRQLDQVREAMSDGNWYTLEELHEKTGFPVSSISARIRDLRKEKNGSYLVEDKRSSNGTWIYRLGERGAGVPRKIKSTERVNELTDSIEQIAKAAHREHDKTGNTSWKGCYFDACRIARDTLRG